MNVSGSVPFTFITRYLVDIRSPGYDRTLNPGSAIWSDTRITDREPFPAQMKDTRIPANFNR